MTRHRVVIIGGGFGGLNTALSIGNTADVTLIDRRNFHVFQPLLYQVATGSLSPGDICAPLRYILRRRRNVTVWMANVVDFDIANRRVVLEHGEVPYDTLIVAVGVDNFYFGNNGWSDHAPGLKTLEDATAMRSRIFEAFERAEREPVPALRREWLRFVVVGAGPTGVELAGALGEIARDTLRGDFRRVRTEESEILLLDGADRVLPQFPPDLSAKAERSLIRLGVRPLLGVRVIAVDHTGVTIRSDRGEERIPSRTVLWGAGVRVTPLVALLAERAGVQVDRSGRIEVNAEFQIPGRPELHVLGDAAAYQQDGEMLPGLASVAIQQGQYLGRAIDARLRSRTIPRFRYSDKGTMATIGRHEAVASLFGRRFGGWLAWYAWLFIHLAFLIGFRNRLVVLTQWGFQYLTFYRGARLITGSKCPD